MFKRRIKRSYFRVVAEAVYPRGGWARAASYVGHRLRRLPDPPHKIARGIAAGVFVSFTPIFGFHFVLSALIAFLLQGNIVASILATFFGNPVTFPIIAKISMETGAWLLGMPGGIPWQRVVGAFSFASVEIWDNIKAIFTSDVAHWTHLGDFFHTVFWPYLVGSLIPGTIVGILAYTVSLPVIEAYQKRRIRRLKQRFEKRRAQAQAAAAAAAREDKPEEG